MQGWGGGSNEGQGGGRQSNTRLLFSFTCSPFQSLQTLPHPFLIPSGLTETGGVGFPFFFFFFHISLSQIKLRKHQLPVYLQIYKIQADVLISCAGENSRLSAH